MTNEDLIQRALAIATTPLDDDELSRRSGVAPRQTVNQICRRLAARGVLTRRAGPDGKIVNALTTTDRDQSGPASAVLVEPVAGSATVAPAAGSSREQRDAEAVMLSVLGQRLGVELVPRRLTHPAGPRVEVDGAAGDLSVLVECWAHQGPAKVAQRKKLLSDAVKLHWIASSLPPGPRRLLLCVSDEAAVAHLRGASWERYAIADLGVEIEVVRLPPDVVAAVVSAQRRQYR